MDEVNRDGKDIALLISGYIAGCLSKMDSEGGPILIDSVKPIYLNGVATTRTEVTLRSGARLSIEVRPIVNAEERQT